MYNLMGGTDRAYKYHLHHLFSVQELGGIKKKSGRNLVQNRIVWYFIDGINILWNSLANGIMDAKIIYEPKHGNCLKENPSSSITESTPDSGGSCTQRRWMLKEY